MSHGGGGGGAGEVSADPNLTPLLDLVLQLVMFFMLVTHFVTEELSDRIKLPIATQAKPLTAKDTNFMYLNVDKTGKVIASGRRPADFRRGDQNLSPIGSQEPHLRGEEGLR